MHNAISGKELKLATQLSGDIKNQKHRVNEVLLCRWPDIAKQNSFLALKRTRKYSSLILRALPKIDVSGTLVAS